MFCADKIRNAFEKIIEDSYLADEITKHLVCKKRSFSLLSNLKLNPQLKTNLKAKILDPEYFAVKMPIEEMRIKTIEKESKIIEKNITYEDSIFRCENCGSYKTEFYEVHRLEETEVYIYCNICKHKFKN
jgi:hypothetical protein